MNQLNFQQNNLGIGKRKRAIARVFLLPGTGNILINQVPGNKYLQYNDNYLTLLEKPFKVLNLEKQFDIIVFVKGGGLTGQVSAIQLGITRLLCSYDSKYRSVLKPHKFLTRDARIKERKKYGLKKARKASQYSKR